MGTDVLAEERGEVQSGLDPTIPTVLTLQADE